jgi:hypothetical protein
MKRKIAYLASAFLLMALAIVVFVRPTSKAQGANACVHACQAAAVAAAQACNGDFACLQQVREAYIACVATCPPGR